MVLLRAVVALANLKSARHGARLAYVRPEVTWIVEQHGLFQTYYYAHHSGRDRNARDKFRDHPWYRACKDFCANWDQSSFDPGYSSEPLRTFEPRVREIFSRPAHDPRYVSLEPV